MDGIVLLLVVIGLLGLGVLLFLMHRIKNNKDILSTVIAIAIAIVSISITAIITHHYGNKALQREQKRLAESAMRHISYLAESRGILMTTIQRKKIIIEKNEGDKINKSLTLEYLDNIYNQVLNISKGINVARDDWKGILSKEYENTTKRDKELIDKILPLEQEIYKLKANLAEARESDQKSLDKLIKLENEIKAAITTYKTNPPDWPSNVVSGNMVNIATPDILIGPFNPGDIEENKTD